MATLTEVSGISRKVIKYGTIFLIVIMLIPAGVRLARSINARLNPPPPPPPTVLFGKLPKLVFPKVEPEATPEFSLETVTGGLPQLGNTGKAYLVKINKSRLKSIDDIRSKARALGFTGEGVPDELGLTYKFTHPNLPAVMKANIVSNGFSYSYDWTSEPQIYTAETIPVQDQAVAEAKGWFTELGLLPKDLADGNGKTQYMVATGSTILPVDSFYDANFTRVDLFRANKDELPVVTAGGDTSPVNVIFTGLSGSKRVAQANYQYSLTLDNESATYPLKTTAEAWEELKSGGGYIAKRTGERVVVRQVYLAYYESSDPQDFLQPVFVFEGDGRFMGLVQAVKKDFVQ